MSEQCGAGSVVEAAMAGVGTGQRPRAILVVTYWSYADALIQTYTLPYLRIMLDLLPPGSQIHLVTLEKAGLPPPACDVPGIVLHTFPYQPFGPKAMRLMLNVLRTCRRLVGQHGIDTIHAWATPAGMIGYLLSVWTGRPLVIDSYEPHAEAMVENGSWHRNGPAFRILFLFECLQSRSAKVLIAAAAGMREYARLKYGVSGNNMLVKPACVDLERFSWRVRKDPALLMELGLEGKLVAVYAGKFGGIYLDQEVFDFLRVARDHWGERFHVLLLTPQTPMELEPFMVKAGLDPTLFTIRFVPHADIPVYMGLADFGITFVKPVPTKRYCTPIKDGEYWALGLPVVITPGISDDSDIIREAGIGSVLEGLNTTAYHKAVLELDALLTTHTTRALYDRIRPIAERNRSFGTAVDVYRFIYGKR